MDLDAALDTLAQNPTAEFDVAEVALHLARDEYRSLDVEAYLQQLDGMAHEVKPGLRGCLDSQVDGLCRYLFHDQGFHGNCEKYYDPRNSYLNEVLERRIGIPISLSVVVMAVGTRAGVPILGIGLPGHFVVKAGQGCHAILFDPFHGGRRLTPESCERLVHEVTGMPFQATPANLRASPAGLIIHRMLSNLKCVYLRERDFPRAIRVLERLRQIDPDDITQRRDLGVCLVQGGQPGRAIDHLSAYLDTAPDDQEAESVRRFLHEAESELAKWN